MTNEAVHGFCLRTRGDWYQKFIERHKMWFSVLGFSSGGMDYGMVGGKEAGTESRFKQWTSMMEGLPSVATQEANMHKNGKSKRRIMSWGCSDTQEALMKGPIKYLKA